MPSTSALVTPSLVLYSSAITGGALLAQNPNLGFLGIKANLQGTCAAASPTANFILLSQVCTSNSVTFTNTSVNASTYTWTATNATPNTSNAGNAVFSFSAAGIQSVSLIASGNTGSASVTYTVNVGATPAITISAPSSICAGSSATLAASGATNYVWNPGNLTTSSIVVTPTALTLYTVTGSIGSCSATLFHTMNVVPAFTVNVTASSPSVCPGNSVTLTASGATTYTWLPGNLSGASVSVNPSSPTTYSVIGTNSSCNSNTTISLGIASSPTVTIQSTSTILCTGSTASLTANGAITYTWSTNANGSSIAVSPTSTTIYTVTGANASGCRSNAILLNP